MKEGDYTVLLLFSCSVMSNFMQPHGLHAAHQVFLPFTISWSLHKLISIESVMSSNHLILCRPLLLLPSNISSIRVFSNELVLCIKWPKDWSFSIWYFSHLMWRTDSFWASSRSCWWIGKHGMLQSMGSQRVRHDWAIEQNWTDQCFQWVFRVDFL